MLSSHEQTKTHARHIHIERLEALGVKVRCLEEDQELQDAVLTVHPACINTLMHTPAMKIIENQKSVAFIAMTVIQQDAATPVTSTPQASETPLETSPTQCECIPK